MKKRRKLYTVPTTPRMPRFSTGGRVGGGKFKYVGGAPGGGKKGPGEILMPEDALKIFDDYDKIAKGVKDVHGVASKLADKVKEKLKTGLNTTVGTNFTISFNPSSMTNGGDETIIPAYVENTKKKMQLANVSDDRHVHKTVVHTGRKPSSSILAVKKVTGTGYRVLADSKMECKSVADRNILTGGCGFNQKSYHIPPIKSQVPVYQIKDLCANDKFIPQEFASSQRIFSNVMNIRQQFMIKNSAANLPMIFTIHLVRIKNSQYAPFSLNSMFTRMFYDSDINDFDIQQNGFVPKYLQHQPLFIESGDTDNMESSIVTVSNKMKSLNVASNFRSGCELVDSFTKTIDAGDYWNFSHIHHCGSGIDITQLIRSTDDFSGEGDDISAGLSTDQRTMPFTYGVIFEVKGKVCEAFEVPVLNSISTYLGTSPCYYSYEFRTSAYFCADETDTANVNTPGTRIYEQDQFVTTDLEREKFIPSSQITASFLNPALESSVSKAYIPTQTSTIYNSNQYEGGQNPG